MFISAKSTPRSFALVLAGIALALTASTPQEKHQGPVGYEDTPLIPGQRWRVHDKHRPCPAIVTPGRRGSPPSDAIVLFDGSSLDSWLGRDGKAAGWDVAGGAMEVNGSGDIHTRDSFGDCQLHIEWRAPAPPRGRSQGRGNSGIFLMGRYELQVLDSYHNRSYADGQACALYGQYPPLVNACRPSGEWQAYDIVFEAPRFEGELLKRAARITVFHNGVLTHNAREFLGATEHRRVPHYRKHPAKAPLQLQDHGNPVRYRNIWIRPLNR